MSQAQLRRRLRTVGERWLDHAYARLAAWWPRGVAPGEEAEVERLFVALTGWERAEGTPLAGILARLPVAMAEGIREQLRTALASREAKHSPKKDASCLD